MTRRSPSCELSRRSRSAVLPKAALLHLVILGALYRDGSSERRPNLEMRTIAAKCRSLIVAIGPGYRCDRR